jgi:predicted phage-related endonuclease
MHALELKQDAEELGIGIQELERKGIKGFDISIINGAKRNKGKYELWCEKAGYINPSYKTSPYSKIHKALKPIIVEQFEERCEKKVQLQNQIWRHPDSLFVQAKPDGWLIENDDVVGAIECRSTSIRHLQVWKEEECPEHLYDQITWDLGVCGLEGGHLAGLVAADPNSFFTPYFEFDQAHFEDLFEAALQFVESIERDVPPDPGPGDAKVIRRVMGERQERIRELSAVQEERAQEALRTIEAVKPEIKAAKRHVKILEDKKKEAENLLKLLAEDATGVILGSTGRAYEIKTINVKERFQAGYSYERIKF